MADRQREFLMAANHYRAGRITIDEFKKKVLVATAVPGEVALVTGLDGGAEQGKEAIAQIEKATAKVVQIQLPDQGLQKKLRSAGAVVMIGVSDLDSISSVAKEAGCPVFFVPDEKCDTSDLAAIAQELPASVALMGKGQAAGAGKIAASVARP